MQNIICQQFSAVVLLYFPASDQEQERAKKYILIWLANTCYAVILSDIDASWTCLLSLEQTKCRSSSNTLGLHKVFVLSVYLFLFFLNSNPPSRDGALGSHRQRISEQLSCLLKPKTEQLMVFFDSYKSRVSQHHSSWGICPWFRSYYFYACCFHFSRCRSLKLILFNS